MEIDIIRRDPVSVDISKKDSTIDIVVEDTTPIDIDVISNGEPIDIDIGGLRPKEYTGTYEVTPLLEAEQELRTENRVLKQNVIIHEIPCVEVSNEKGKTLIIGE